MKIRGGCVAASVLGRTFSHDAQQLLKDMAPLSDPATLGCSFSLVDDWMTNIRQFYSCATSFMTHCERFGVVRRIAAQTAGHVLNICGSQVATSTVALLRPDVPCCCSTTSVDLSWASNMGIFAYCVDRFVVSARVIQTAADPSLYSIDSIISMSLELLSYVALQEPLDSIINILLTRLRYYENLGRERFYEPSRQRLVWSRDAGPDRRHRKGWRPFHEAVAYVRSLNIRGQKEWSDICKSGNLPSDIPRAPSCVYGQDWISLGHWLGSGRAKRARRTSSALRQSFLSLRDIAMSRFRGRIKSSEDYTISMAMEPRLPKHPESIFKYTGWQGYRHFGGFESPLPLSYGSAIVYSRSLGLKTKDQWQNFTSTHAGRIKYGIPLNPDAVYGASGNGGGGWISWDFWLIDEKAVYVDYPIFHYYMHALGVDSIDYFHFLPCS